MNIKKVTKFIYIKSSKLIMPLFYEKKYLRGKWFDNSVKGWKWCWRSVFMQKFVGYNKRVPFPMSHRSKLGNAKNIEFSLDDISMFQHFGCYFQNYSGRISIGRGTHIAPNVGLITENHDLKNLDVHQKPKDIYIGEGCWIGMNSMILPGTVLGDNTVVGAGSVVTKSFEEGNCVIAGNPARKIRSLDHE